jgi:hypothetical protein
MIARQVLSVKQADHDTTCRLCQRPIRRGRRVALVLGTGDVCLHCLISGQAAGTEEGTSP